VLPLTTRVYGRFLIDAFHTFNHKEGSCSIAFSIARLSAAINSSILEQWHSHVDALTDHMRSMAQPSFMFTLQVNQRNWNLSKFLKSAGQVLAARGRPGQIPLLLCVDAEEEDEDTHPNNGWDGIGDAASVYVTEQDI
jgi:hypothetical protein